MMLMPIRLSAVVGVFVVGPLVGWDRQAFGQCFADSPSFSFGCDGGEPWTLANCWSGGTVPNAGISAGFQSAGGVPLGAGASCNDLSLLSGSAVVIEDNGTLGIFGDCVIMVQGGIDLMPIVPAPMNPGIATLTFFGGATVRGSDLFTGTRDGIRLVSRGEATLGDAIVTGGPLTLEDRVSISGTGTVTAPVINNATPDTGVDADPLFGVVADVSGRTLALSGGGTNNADMSAVDGGVLALSGSGWSQGSGGVIGSSANGVVTASVNITGGTVESGDDGTVNYVPPMTLTGVTISGPGPHSVNVGNGQALSVNGSTIAAGTTLGMQPGSSLNVSTSMTNNGTLVVNSTASAATTAIVRTFNSTLVSIDGTGDIVLNAESDTNLASAGITGNLTLGMGQTLRGTGVVNQGPVTVDGEMIADVPGRSLRATSVTANGPVGAVGGGVLEFPGVSNFQPNTGPGGFYANTGGVLRFESSSQLFETTVTTDVTGVVEFVRVSNLRSEIYDDVTFDGTIVLRTDALVDAFGKTVTNHGTITVGEGAGGQTVYRVRGGSNKAIAGTGTLTLNAPAPAQLTDAQLVGETVSGAVINRAGHTIAGRGQITRGTNAPTFLNEGIVSPGFGPTSTGTIAITQRYTTSDTGVLEFDIAGATPDSGFDVLSSPSNEIALDGTVRVRFAAGFTPASGDTFAIITAPGTTIFNDITGDFDTVEIMGLPQTLGATILVTASAATVAVIDLDLDGSGAVDFLDVLFLLGLFDAGDPAAEFDGVPGLTSNDVLVFLQALAG